jgi:hypothetical protein
MKRLALTALLVTLAANVFSQGQINFFTFNNNTAFGQVYLPGTIESVNNLFSGQLAISSTSNGVFSVIGTVGDFSGGGPGQPSAINVGAITVNGFNGGDNVYYKLLVWNDAAGGDFTTASVNPSGVVGMSAPVSVTLGGGLFTVPATTDFASFALAAVPEPSVIALGILGAAAVILRRRKA